MSSTWGKNIRLSLFGESHGAAIGIVIDGLPAGIKLDMDRIHLEMERRRPGKNAFSTQRNESDQVEIVSGYFNEYTTGTPLTAIIRNSDKRSNDYAYLKAVMRPGHADYTGKIRYKSFNDYRGGGHFSGRLTAPLVFAGAIAAQILEEKGIYTASHIKSIYNIEDKAYISETITIEQLKNLKSSDFPVLDIEAGEKMKAEILASKEDKDSVGGIIETVVLNIPAGLGNPFFESLESKLASMMFSIPAVKGIEFGIGFEFSKMRGSAANDILQYEKGRVTSKTNHNGGINGGISNGMPLVFSLAIKPTPSISKEQDTVDVEHQCNTKLEIKGRHDPCIVQRAVPVVEAATALVIIDTMLESKSL